MNTTPLSLVCARPPEYIEPTYLTRLRRLARGLRSPRGTRAYKEARIEAQRLAAPAAALLVPLLTLALALLLPARPPAAHARYTVTFRPLEEPPLLKPLDPAALPEPQPVQAFPAFEEAPPASPVAEPPALTSPAPATPPADLTAVRNVRSTRLLTGLLGDGRGAGKNALLTLFNGTRETEDAVLRALRWLKKNQRPDGAWNSQTVAMTGLALLTFLSHGDTPDTDTYPEFGPTVQRAIEFLLAAQRPDGRFRGCDGNEYAHPIAAYALCEAYGMTLNPNAKAAAEKAVALIVKGQHPTGGWTYRLDPATDPATGAYRDDTSYMGWCAQALKTAQMVRLDVDGLGPAVKRAVRGFQRNANPNGGFGYTGPGQGGLTSVGTLCLQLLGAADTPDVKRSLRLMSDWAPSLDAKAPIGASLQYYCYYATQCKFHAGGKAWEQWNARMKPLYLQAQQIERNAVRDADGRPADIGWWVNGDSHTDRPVMDTCLVALQLMVYYRGLLTTSVAALRPEEELKASATETGDIRVNLPEHL